MSAKTFTETGDQCQYPAPGREGCTETEAIDENGDGGCCAECHAEYLRLDRAMNEDHETYAVYGDLAAAGLL